MNATRRAAAPLLTLLLLLVGGGSLAGQDPEIMDAYYRSYDYERTEDYMNGIRALAGVFDAFPEGYTVNLRMGWLYYLNGNYANSLDHYGTAQRVAPYSLEAKVGSLLPLLAQERYVETESLAYQVVSVDYYNYYGNMRLGLALRMEGKLEAARMVIAKMLTAYPSDPLFLTELGLIAAAEGDSEAARKTFEDVLILDPENPTAKAYLRGG